MWAITFQLLKMHLYIYTHIQVCMHVYKHYFQSWNLMTSRTLCIQSHPAQPTLQHSVAENTLKKKKNILLSSQQGLSEVHHTINNSVGYAAKWEHPARSPFILAGQLVDPGRRVLSHEAHVIVGTGRRLVGEVRGERGRPIVFDHHYVVLRHVHGRGELVVA